MADTKNLAADGINPPSAAFLFTPTESGNLWRGNMSGTISASNTVGNVAGILPTTTVTDAGQVGQAPNGAQPDKNANGGGNQQPQMVQMSQADFDRIIGDRATRAKSTEREELLKLLGVETPDQAKELIKAAQEAREAQMTEVQKWQVKAEQAEKEAERARADREQAETLRRETLLRYALMEEAMKPDYNLNPQAIADVWTLIDKSEIKLDENGKATGMDRALQALVKAKPYLVSNAAAKSPGTPLRQRAPAVPSTAQPVKTVSRL